MPDYSKLCGWLPVEQWTPAIRRTVRDYTSSLAYPDFELSAPYAAIKGAGDGVDVFHWTAELKLFGKMLPAYHQTIGSCVSQGWGRAAQDQLLIDAAIRLEPEDLPAELKKDLIVATEPIYGGRSADRYFTAGSRTETRTSRSAARSPS